MYCHDLAIAGRRAAKFSVRSLLIAGFALALGGCNTTARDTTGSIPDDYRERHPIRIKEGQNTLALLVGSGRGELSPMQRAEVLAFAQNWKREATGGITIDRPVGGGNDRAKRLVDMFGNQDVIHAFDVASVRATIVRSAET